MTGENREVESTVATDSIAWSSASAELGAKDERDGLGQTPPFAGLFRELLAAAGGELVEARAAIVVGDAPFGAQPSRGLEALESGVERAVVDEQCALRRALNGERDPVAVMSTKRQRSQDEEVECSLKER